MLMKSCKNSTKNPTYPLSKFTYCHHSNPFIILFSLSPSPLQTHTCAHTHAHMYVYFLLLSEPSDSKFHEPRPQCMS